MTDEFEHVFFCRKCRRLRKVYEGHREALVLPEQNPEFDVVIWCCTACKEPIVEITAVSKRR